MASIPAQLKQPLRLPRLPSSQPCSAAFAACSVSAATAHALGASHGDPIVVASPRSADDEVRLCSLAVRAGRGRCDGVEEDAVAAVRIGSAPQLAAALRARAAAKPVAAAPIGDRDSGDLLVAALPPGAVKPASSVAVSLASMSPGGALPLPAAALLSQLRFLLDEVVLAAGCTVSLPVAGAVVLVRVERTTPSGASQLLLVRAGSDFTRFTLADGAGPPAQATTSAPVGSPAAVTPAAVHSPWKQPLAGGAPATPTVSSLRAATPASPFRSPPPAPQPQLPAGAAIAHTALAAGSTPQRATHRGLSRGSQRCGSPSDDAKELEEVEAEEDEAHDAPLLPSPSSSSSSSVAGLEDAFASLYEVVVMPFTPAGRRLLRRLRLAPPTGVLLHGPPGCGKTQLVRSIASAVRTELPALRVRVLCVGGPELLSPVVGEPERRLRALFAEARAFAAGPARTPQPPSSVATPSAARAPGGDAEGERDAGLSIIFLDEVDALCPKRAGGSGGSATAGESSAVAVRLTTQLLALMDGAAPAASSGRVVVIAATNRPAAVDPALRRPGRLDREIAIQPPHAAARAGILRLHTAALRLDDAAATALPALAEGAVGYVGADLAAVCAEAASRAAQRCMAAAAAAAEPAAAAPPPPAVLVTLPDMLDAFGRVGASCLRGVSVSAPRTAWSEIGGCAGPIRALREAVERPLTHAALYARMGLALPRGVLLHGPPGNAKTTLVRALASAVRASFLCLSGADIYSPFVGEAEARLRAAFATARAALPCVLFLDELDALVGPARGGIGGGAGGGGGAASSVSAGILATLLTEMDGLQGAAGILVVGATNRPHALDPALLRPGRLEVHVAVPPPDAQGRAEVLAVHTRRMPLGAGVDLAAVAAAAVGLSGAELEGLAREAAMGALREDVACAAAVGPAHFQAALVHATRARAAARG